MGAPQNKPSRLVIPTEKSIHFNVFDGNYVNCLCLLKRVTDNNSRYAVTEAMVQVLHFTPNGQEGREEHI